LTGIKEAEEALDRERLLLRTLIDNLPDSVYAKDTAGRKTLANPADLKNLVPRCFRWNRRWGWIGWRHDA